MIRLKFYRDLPGSPVVKTRAATAGGTGSIPGWGTKIPCAVQCSKKKKMRLCGFHKMLCLSQ